MLSNLRHWPIWAFLSLLSLQVNAEGGRVDYDLDNDGLIEINDLADLDEIRNHLDGSALYGDNNGCPEDGCNGFELTANLDFDTNEDGQINELDRYWNEGEGWKPIGSFISTAYTGNFDGNGFALRNLYSKSSTYGGLFGAISGKENSPVSIHRLAIIGENTQISGQYESGVLAGYIRYATVDQIFVTGRVYGTSSGASGGAIGSVFNSSVINLFSSADVLAGSSKSGLIGNATDSTISNSISTGFIAPNTLLQGPAGMIASGTFTANNIYWSKDTSGQTRSLNSSEIYFGATLSELKCPESENSSNCTSEGVLYQDWESEIWDFGSADQLPGLLIGSNLYRDSDGDSHIDSDDEYPYDFAISKDSDSDEHADSYSIGCDLTCAISSGHLVDGFPDDPSAWRDDDLDGRPDSWATNCDSSCQSTSLLSLDLHPNDYDNDGTADNLDNDDNEDGIIDIDSDSDGLIDIDTIEDLITLGNRPDGYGYTTSLNADPDTSGCPVGIWLGKPTRRCSGYELIADLDFDTNNDGILNEEDAYWNDGLGWNPIAVFSGYFNGQGHTIRNLYSNRPSIARGGLFKLIVGKSENDIKIENLIFSGPLTKVTAGLYVGILSATIERANIRNIHVTGEVTSNYLNSRTGGLAGLAYRSTISNILSTSIVSDGQYRGGLLGELKISTLENSLTTGAVFAQKFRNEEDGLVGLKSESAIENVYWANDLTGYNGEKDISVSSFGTTLYNLQCPTTQGESTCSPEGTLYLNWPLDSWDFGTSEQLPGLIINGVIHRDSDGDGIQDDLDDLPLEYAAAKDSDGDGYADYFNSICDYQCQSDNSEMLDFFPDSPAAGQDTDFDGYPDEWTIGCDSTCQNASGLRLDTHPDDHDNDGLSDDVDTDDNNDGVEDADADSDGLIDIGSLTELNAMRFSLDGVSQRMTEFSDADTSGCPAGIHNGQLARRCNGYELVSNLDFDTNQDGLMNESDEYWNAGSGWLPIGVWRSPFETNFNGQGYLIQNLYSYHPELDEAGLFGYVIGEDILLEQVAFAGPLTSVTAEYFAGVLAGYVYKASMDKIYVAGTTNGVDSAGGVAGVLYWGELTNSFSSVNTSAVRNAGGLIAIAGYSRISNSISIGQAMPNSADSGGVIGESEYMSYQHLHWATDVSGAQGSAGVDESETYFGAILTELQCPTTPDDRSCREGDVLYQSWASSVWNFGTTEQLPGLIIRGSVYRDGDGDGALDPNATPSVLIKMYQDGNEESTIVEGMGDVTIEAFITDPDEHDTFTLYWSIDGITEYTELGNSITFSSNGLPAGDYSITVVVTDSGVPSQSDSASTTVRVISDIAPISEDQTDSSPETNDTLPSDNSTDDGGRSGGGSIAWLLLLLIATIICHRQSYFVSKT